MGEAAEADKRLGMPPIPVDYEKILTSSQLQALRSIENFGWSLHFVRREGRDIPMPVIKGADGKSIGVIDEDGNLDMNPNIFIRD
jgi:hypothetical protein